MNSVRSDRPYPDSVGKDEAVVTASCVASLSLQGKKLHHDISPAVIDMSDRQPSTYFLNGVEHTEEEHKRRTAPGASTCADIEKA